MSEQKTFIDESIYRNARSPRPAWANTLIFALIAFLAGIVGVMTGTVGLIWVAFVATPLLLAIAGILALTTVRKPQ